MRRRFPPSGWMRTDHGDGMSPIGLRFPIPPGERGEHPALAPMLLSQATKTGRANVGIRLAGMLTESSLSDSARRMFLSSDELVESRLERRYKRRILASHFRRCRRLAGNVLFLIFDAVTFTAIVRAAVTAVTTAGAIAAIRTVAAVGAVASLAREQAAKTSATALASTAAPTPTSSGAPASSIAATSAEAATATRATVAAVAAATTASSVTCVRGVRNDHGQSDGRQRNYCPTKGSSHVSISCITRHHWNKLLGASRVADPAAFEGLRFNCILMH